MTFDAPKPMIGPVNRTSSTSTKPELEIVSDVPECVIAAVDFVMIMLSPSVVTPDTPSVLETVATAMPVVPVTVAPAKFVVPSTFKEAKVDNPDVCNVPVTPMPEVDSVMIGVAPTPSCKFVNRTLSTSTNPVVLEI
jgi:hypothetical protein